MDYILNRKGNVFMDHDKLVEEQERLQKLLATYGPTTDEYAKVEERLIKLAKLEFEFNESSDKQNERLNKFELEREKIKQEFSKQNRELEFKMQELKLKEKELELRNGLEAMKLEDNAEEARNRRRAEKRQAWFDLGKIVLQIGGTAALIGLTGKIEQGVIFGHNKWSLIPKPKI